MRISKKYLPFIALVVVLAIANITLAVLYMTRDVNITGGVSVVGSIEVYDEDGVTILTNYEFPNFTGGEPATSVKNFFINNTGNQPVYIYWNITSSSVNWTANVNGYVGFESAVHKYNFFIATSWSPDPFDYWVPNDYSTPEALFLDVGEGKELQIRHQYTGEPNTAELYSLTMRFYAEDA
jgi:hypothetical protein